MFKKFSFLVVSSFILSMIFYSQFSLNAQVQGNKNLIRNIPAFLSKVAVKETPSETFNISKKQLAILDSKAYEVSNKTFVESKKDPTKGFVDLICPKNTNVFETAPTFAWLPVQGATEYEIKLVNVIDEIWTAKTSNTQIVYPSTAPELKQGKFYFWAVRANGASNYFSPYSYFYIVKTDEKNRVSMAIKSLEDNIISLSNLEKEIILASYYESKGFYGYAEDHYLKAKTYLTHPQDKEDFNKLLGNLYVKTDQLHKAIDLLGLLKNK